MIEKSARRSPCEKCEAHRNHVIEFSKGTIENFREFGKNSDVCRYCTERLAYLRYLDDLLGTCTRSDVYIYHTASHVLTEPEKPISEWNPIPTPGNKNYSKAKGV